MASASDPAEEETRTARAVAVSAVTPHNRALYEAGKTLLIDSVKTGQEYCKSMITIALSAIPVYLGLLVFLLPEQYVLGLAAGAAIAVPALLFLIAAVLFSAGYMPAVRTFSLDVVEEIERERERVLKRRARFIWGGFGFFLLGALGAISVVVLNLGVR